MGGGPGAARRTWHTLRVHWTQRAPHLEGQERHTPVTSRNAPRPQFLGGTGRGGGGDGLTGGFTGGGGDLSGGLTGGGGDRGCSSGEAGRAR